MENVDKRKYSLIMLTDGKDGQRRNNALCGTQHWMQKRKRGNLANHSDLAVEITAMSTRVKVKKIIPMKPTERLMLEEERDRLIKRIAEASRNLERTVDELRRRSTK